MDIEKINEMLLTGLSLAATEKELGYGKDTLRKKLNRAGYHFNKKTRQYVHDEKEIELTLEAPAIRKVHPVTKKNITDVVTPSYPQQESHFSLNEIEILHKIIKEYQIRESIQFVGGEPNGTLVNRNIRVYKEQYDTFSTWCKANNLTQASALYKAIELLMISIGE